MALLRFAPARRPPARRLARLLTAGLLGALGSGVVDVAFARGHPDARLAAEWEPGWSAAEVGGRFTVDGYGVGGLGAYRLAQDDGGVALAVCVQADIGHSMSVDYRLDAAPSVASAELDYLLWRMSGPPGIADDLTAAATNVLAWRYAGAARSTGGSIWSGDAIEIAVIGVGRRTDIESAVAALHAEASRRRGPWELAELAPTPDGTAFVTTVAGPGGPIAGVAVGVAIGAQTWSVITDADGRAEVEPPDGLDGRIVVTVSSPGPARTWSAPGSQRVAVAGTPVGHQVEHTIAPPPTTTAITLPPTTTRPSTTTTITPSTTTTTTVSPTTTTPPTTTTTAPSTTTTTTTVSPTTVMTTTSTVPPTTTPTTQPSTTNVPSTTTSTVPPTTTTVPTTTGSTSTTVPLVGAPMPAPPPLTPLTQLTPSTSPPPSPPALPRTGGAARWVVRAASLLVAIGGVTVLVATRQRRVVR